MVITKYIFNGFFKKSTPITVIVMTPEAIAYHSNNQIGR